MTHRTQIRFLISALVVTSSLSCLLAWQSYKFRGGNLNVPFLEYGPNRISYPLYGLSLKDMKDILELVDSIPESERGGGIIQINSHGDDHVIIMTGSGTGPLSGGGRVLYIFRTESGWSLDPVLSSGGWAA